MGLGGSSCGPRPLAKYQTLSGATALGFVLAPSSALLNLARTVWSFPIPLLLNGMGTAWSV